MSASRTTVITGRNESMRAGQQLAASLLSKVTATDLKRAGITREQYVTACRQLLGYSSHQVSIPAYFGPRYDPKSGKQLWGRPKPAPSASKPASKGGKSTRANGSQKSSQTRTRSTRTNGTKPASKPAPKVQGASPASMPARKPASVPATVSA